MGSRKLDQRNLAYKPFGAIFDVNDIFTSDAIYAPSLNFVAIEAFLDGPGHPDPNVNVASLNTYLDQAKDRVRQAGKSAVLVMMGYDKFGTPQQWFNIDNLAALQAPVYLKAYNDSLVVAITIFAYGRQGGTRDHAQLAAVHQDIWAAINGGGGPSPPQVALQASNGQWIVAEDTGDVNANRNAIGAWETFQLIDLGSGYVALRAWNGKYVVAEGGGGQAVLANRDAIGAWETFRLIQLGGGFVALQANNGQYVVAEGGGGGVVNANRDQIGGWETFFLQYIQ